MVEPELEDAPPPRTLVPAGHVALPLLWAPAGLLMAPEVTTLYPLGRGEQTAYTLNVVALPDMLLKWTSQPLLTGYELSTAAPMLPPPETPPPTTTVFPGHGSMPGVCWPLAAVMKPLS